MSALSDQDKALLLAASRYAGRPAHAVGMAMSAATGMSQFRCWQRLNELIHVQAAWEYAPGALAYWRAHRERNVKI